jgi:hypothetical protein
MRKHVEWQLTVGGGAKQTSRFNCLQLNAAAQLVYRQLLRFTLNILASLHTFSLPIQICPLKKIQRWHTDNPLIISLVSCAGVEFHNNSNTTGAIKNNERRPGHSDLQQCALTLDRTWQLLTV